MLGPEPPSLLARNGLRTRRYVEAAAPVSDACVLVAPDVLAAVQYHTCSLQCHIPKLVEISVL